MPSLRWLNMWWTGYQRMRFRMTQTRKDKYSTEHDCFFGSLNQRASHSGLTASRSNLVSPEQSWRHHSIGVLNWAWYCASWFMGSTQPCLSPGKSCQSWWCAIMPKGHLRRRPRMEQAIGSPVTSYPAREACGPCWEMSLQDEHDLYDSTLKHNPTRGAGNGTGWMLMGALGTHVPRLLLTNLLQELH